MISRERIGKKRAKTTKAPKNALEEKEETTIFSSNYKIDFTKKETKSIAKHVKQPQGPNGS